MSDMQAVYQAIALEVQQQLTQKYAVAKIPKVFLSFKQISQTIQRKHRLNIQTAKK